MPADVTYRLGRAPLHCTACTRVCKWQQGVEDHGAVTAKWQAAGRVAGTMGVESALLLAMWAFSSGCELFNPTMLPFYNKTNVL